MSKRKTIDAFFKKKDVSNSEFRTLVTVETNVDTSMVDEHPSKCSRIQSEEINRDLGSRTLICEFPINKQDEIRRAYLNEGPYQPKNIEYPYNNDNHRHRFQGSWIESHSDSLEYSPSMDAIYCLSCFLFGKKPIDRPRSDAFISTASIVLENALRNAKYTSLTIQKEILHILANKVRNAIREEIGGDNTALTLKNDIYAVLFCYNLHIENIRGQKYDGASNMHGEWNGLQALFLKEFPYTYCRNDELQYAQGEQIENMIDLNEIETGRATNHIGTLQRAGDTRWGSHFQSICSLIKMFDATCKVINTIFEEGANYKQSGDAE
ncbi:uncharacterized protein LOC142620117 [Castanea sativa]|uniref:uncharacterized protein LOC142620117 n=1 Tax=Castanea sativa TaxID=21020 RepID=UPI003F651EFA